MSENLPETAAFIGACCNQQAWIALSSLLTSLALPLEDQIRPPSRLRTDAI
jgi:hypothetical protein